MSSKVLDMHLLVANMSEAEFQAKVRKFAKEAGWLIYHTRDSRGSDKGFPDLVLVRPPYVVFAELKREGEKPTPEQQRWLDDLDNCGQAAYLWRPSDWDEILKVLT